MTHIVPPALAERLLRSTIRDAEWRDAVTGDLREELATVAARHGAFAARRWYWRHALPLAARFAAGRIVPALKPAPRRRLSVAELEHTSSLGTGWSREVRHAWRALSQRPGLSTVIVGTLALALAANAVVFTLADALYLRPFRFPDVDRLVLITSDTRAGAVYLDRESVAPADFRDWRDGVTTVTGLAAAEFWDPNLSGIDIPEQLPGFHVTPGFFDLLGAAPVAGRTFRADEGRPGAHRVVVLSHAAWLRRFGGTADVLGRSIRLDGEPYEIVGVMPPRFAIPYGADVWAPLAYDDTQWQQRTSGTLMTFARLAPGRSLADARAEFTALAARLAAAHPETNRERGVTVLSFARGLGDDAVGPILVMWQAAALLVLLVACANIANLLLARATERQPEFDVRLALGASRARLVLQLLIEGTCLAVLGVTAGAGLAVAALKSARTMLPASVVRFVPGYEFLQFDLASLAAMAALGATATVIFTLLPALQASRGEGGAALTRGTRMTTGPSGRQWVRSALAGAQVALSLTLVVAAALIVGGVRRASDGAMGFDKQQLMTADLTLPARPYADPARRRAFVTTMLNALGAEPGVMTAAVASSLPYAAGYTQRPFVREGAAPDDAGVEARTADLVRITPALLDAMRVRFVSGRTFTDGDGADAPPVALVSRALVERFFTGTEPLGQRFRLADDGEWLTVVGVVDDVIQDWLSGQRRPTVYRPFAQDPTLHLSVVARTSVPPATLASGMRRAVAAADSDQPIFKLAPMTQVVSDRLSGVGYFADVLTAMSAIALLLALTGMYSLMTYMAARRTQELGVRLALGATPAQVTWLGVSRTLGITGGGLALGAVLAVVVSRLMAATLYGLVRPDPLVVAAAAASLAGVALLAGYLPARAAARQDPSAALRTD
ncbi:MAG: ABC transporter permease [Acidobacteria bacterium]|nr:ABC transporter permease [Acidobacteriota bacterium]